jgi:hypothetical protein
LKQLFKLPEHKECLATDKIEILFNCLASLENGGMGLGGDENTRLYLKTSGQEFLEDKEGIRLFEDILSQEETNLYVFVGQKERVNRFPV